ncbi:MAG TPA: Bax inhibitor-1/YccA family protein [Rhizomicrobium sp.]|jgi:FtsH-binding integral membrane protein|nr:Bax inhibitor-1/YccA family protein [Rhizomicrobium sp.]
MADYDNRLARSADSAALAVDAGLRAYMLRVYNYMLVGLGLTGAVAWLTANTPLVNVFYNQVQTANGIGIQPNILGWIAVFAPLAMVFFLSFRLQKMSFAAAQTTFWVYAALMGVSLSTILFLYTGTSIALTFFVTAATFGAMSLWGYTTSRDLTGFGSFLFMGLIGLILASLANFFFRSSQLQFVVSVIGVLIFTGLTAYDSQSIKNMYFTGDDSETTGKKAIMGALRLYLDFINLFLYLLRFMGNRR